ncbi:alpha/beta hydrolase [Nocardia sp. NPDC127579]|uniref:alpha/beta hydrolase n=1 Tax=Nocardia sp. NPDC127579 TaxID=3345402 RepID=UPI0036448184
MNYLRSLAILITGLCTLSLFPAWHNSAPATAATGAWLVGQTPREGRLVEISVHSQAMDRDISLQVLRPPNTALPAPTLYLLNGAGGGEDAANWLGQTDAAAFFADKHVNIVIPMEGAFSYYTDWQNDDPGLAEHLGNNGRNMWATFLTKELPPVIDATFGTTGKNALAGISMAGTSVLDLTIQAPDLYRAAAAYSGCAMTSDPWGMAFVKTVVQLGKGDAENMWGPYDGDGWRAHDPYVQADRLPRIPMYISSGTGLPGRFDSLDNARLDNDNRKLVNQMLVGGLIETVTNYCTGKLSDRLRALGRTDITVNQRPAGTHSWGYWQTDLHQSWPMLAGAIGL